jgi:hypothetical protein
MKVVSFVLCFLLEFYCAVMFSLADGFDAVAGYTTILNA